MQTRFLIKKLKSIQTTIPIKTSPNKRYKNYSFFPMYAQVGFQQNNNLTIGLHLRINCQKHMVI